MPVGGGEMCLWGMERMLTTSQYPDLLAKIRKEQAREERQSKAQ